MPAHYQNNRAGKMAISTFTTLSLVLVLLVVLSCTGMALGDDLTKWRDICPRSECESVSMREQKEQRSTGVVHSGSVKVYCVRPVETKILPALRHIWHRHVIAVTSINDASLTLLLGNSSFVVHQQSSGGGWWSSNSLKNDLSNSFSPYDAACVGVKGDGVTFTITFEKKLILYYPIFLLVGLFLFFGAPGFSRNVTFYYASGISIGIVASLLVLLYVFSKFVPKKNLLGLGVLFSGYGAVILVFRWLWSNGVEFMLNNLFYILIYTVVSGIASFAFLYWRGPASVRTLSLFQWALQLIGLLLVWSSSQLQTVSVVLLGVVIVFYHTRLRLMGVFNHCCCCLNPILRLFRRYPKRKLLTKEEYEHQAVVETDKALKQLRQYCRRNSSIYDTVDSLQNQKGFLNFMAGKDHVSVHERDEHEADFPLFYDSSDDDSIPSPEVSFVGSTSFPSSPSPAKRFHRDH